MRQMCQSHQNLIIQQQIKSFSSFFYKNGSYLFLQESVFEGSAWEWDNVRGAYYYHAFLASQPDLNYRNKRVLEKMDVRIL
jgi:glycosidase